MSNPTDFSDHDIKAIKEKVSRKYDAALRRLLILYIPLSLIFPYIPTIRGGGTRSIDRMEYSKAVFHSG